MADNQPKFNLLAAEKQCVCECVDVYRYIYVKDSIKNADLVAILHWVLYWFLHGFVFEHLMASSILCAV